MITMNQPPLGLLGHVVILFLIFRGLTTTLINNFTVNYTLKQYIVYDRNKMAQSEKGLP